MFMVMVVHADFYMFDPPTAVDAQGAPMGTFGRILFESMTLCCVNVFVMISGWFGIRSTVKGFCNFLTQALFFTVGMYFLCILCGLGEFNIHSFLLNIYIDSRYWWFVIAYAGLYILAPVLNAFIESASTRRLAAVVIAFYIFQSYYGWFGIVAYFETGYSTLSFIGLYLLAALLRRYQRPAFKWGGVAYLLAISAHTAFYYFALSRNLDNYIGLYDSYCNPLTVMAAASLVCWASTWRLGANKIINFVAASAFAVYLFHMSPAFVHNVFNPVITDIYNATSGLLTPLCIFIFLVLLFAIAVLLDQPRKWLWRHLLAPLFPK